MRLYYIGAAIVLSLAFCVAIAYLAGENSPHPIVVANQMLGVVSLCCCAFALRHPKFGALAMGAAMLVYFASLVYLQAISQDTGRFYRFSLKMGVAILCCLGGAVREAIQEENRQEQTRRANMPLPF